MPKLTEQQGWDAISSVADRILAANFTEDTSTKYSYPHRVFTRTQPDVPGATIKIHVCQEYNGKLVASKSLVLGPYGEQVCEFSTGSAKKLLTCVEGALVTDLADTWAKIQAKVAEAKASDRAREIYSKFGAFKGGYCRRDGYRIELLVRVDIDQPGAEEKLIAAEEALRKIFNN